MTRIVFSVVMGMLILFTGSAKKQVYSKEAYTTTVILGTWRWDVETNKQGSSDIADFWWEQITDKERCLVPVNGAKAKLIPNVDFNTIDPAFIDKQTLSTDKISGADEGGVLVPGAVVVFRTVEGNLGKIQIERYRALHDFTFQEAEYLSEQWKSFVLKKPNREKYHLQVKWKLFR